MHAQMQKGVGGTGDFERKIVNIFLPINFNICCGYSKDSSFEYPNICFG